MVVSVLDVADWFLTLAEAEEKQLEHMQLQRLCCYAQGFALALYGDALFGNPIEVAEDGPMVREVWDCYGGCDSVPSVLSPVPLAVPTQGIAGAVRFVYERFGARSAAELAALAPQEPPWKLANCRVDNSPFNWSTMHDFLRSELEAADQEDDARAVDIDTLIDRLQHDDELRASLRRGQADIQAGRVRRHVQL